MGIAIVIKEGRLIGCVPYIGDYDDEFYECKYCLRQARLCEGKKEFHKTKVTYETEIEDRQDE